MNKKIILKGLGIGIVILIVAEILSFGYGFILIKLFPSGTKWSLFSAVVTATLPLIYWVCHPASKIFTLLGGQWLRKIFMYPMHTLIFLRFIDLIFWSGLSIFVLYKKALLSKLAEDQT